MPGAKKKKKHSAQLLIPGDACPSLNKEIDSLVEFIPGKNTLKHFGQRLPTMTAT